MRNVYVCLSAAHTLFESAWLAFLLVYGWNFFAALFVSNSLLTHGSSADDDGCPDAVDCGAIVDAVVLGSACQPLLVVLGIVGMFVRGWVSCCDCRMSRHWGNLTRTLYWLGNILGIAAAAFQMAAVLGGVSSAVLLAPLAECGTVTEEGDGVRRLQRAVPPVAPDAGQKGEQGTHWRKLQAYDEPSGHLANISFYPESCEYWLDHNECPDGHVEVGAFGYI